MLFSHLHKALFVVRHTMSDIQINKDNLGASEIMGPLLRQFVEEQLVDDLRNYEVKENELYFDWSNSCAEGHSSFYLDGTLENFSYISVYNTAKNLIAEGWLDFVDNFFDTDAEKTVIVYWDFITVFDKGQRKIIDKSSPGIPNHIWERLDQGHKNIYKDYRQKGMTIGLP